MAALLTMRPEELNRFQTLLGGFAWMVQVGGLEPPTSGSTDQRSNQLSYTCTGDGGVRRCGRNLGSGDRFGKRLCPPDGSLKKSKKKGPAAWRPDPGFVSGVALRRLS